MGRKNNVGDRTEQTFGAIEKLSKTGISPTLREIGAEIDIPSTSLVDYYLRKLEKAGRIKRVGKKSRSILIIPPESLQTVPLRGKGLRLGLAERSILDIPNFGPIAAGYQFHLPDASFQAARKNLSEDTIIQIPESYLPAGVSMDDLFALQVEGDSMRDAMLTDGDIVILQKTSIDRVKDGDIVAAWLVDKHEATLKRFQRTKRGISLRPENPEYETIFLEPHEVEIQGKLLAVLRFRY
jgi:repressor LexA